jgi:Acetyltransferases, including N-acetylases of ribosomal proteins
LGPEQTQVDIMTRSGDDYRGKGYASKTVETGMKWIENNTQIKDVFWDVRKDNIGSIKIAKKNGFEYVGDANKNWSTYKKTYKRD